MQAVLVIESEPADLVIQALILRCLGYNVLEAANTSEAMETCDVYPGPIHLVVARDAPDKDPFAGVVHKLKCRCPEVCVLLISDGPRGKRPNDYPQPCECALLEKPFHVEALEIVIKELLGHQRLTFAA
jgi:DNA-binding NtrC family response regulator